MGFSSRQLQLSDLRVFGISFASEGCWSIWIIRSSAICATASKISSICESPVARCHQAEWLNFPSRYLVVDLMNGGDLRFHISRKTFTEDAVRFWMAELACALRYIHGQGIVHRDLKPDNVLLDSEGHVHLADFVSLVLRSGVKWRLMYARTLLRNLDRTNHSTASPGLLHTLLPRFMRAVDILVRWIGGRSGSLSTNAFSTR